MAQLNKEDREIRRRAKKRFALATKLEKEYNRSLLAVVAQIDHLVKAFVNEDGTYNSDLLEQSLKSYAKILEPWAFAVAEKIISRVIDKDAIAWIELSKSMGANLRKELNEAPVGFAMRQFMQEQVKLITSLPIEAASRVHESTIKGISEGKRANEIAKEILKTGEVTKSRAQLIARTEIARTASAVTMERAKELGSTHYYWRTSGDHDVRIGHKHMNGKICSWNDPPEVNEGTPENPRYMKHHPGMIWNCRCYPEPIFDEVF